MPTETRYRGLFVFEFGEKTFLSYQTSKSSPTLKIATSKNGEKFFSSSKPIELLSVKGKSEHWTKTDHFRVTTDKKQALLTFVRESAGADTVIVAQSKNGLTWKTLGKASFKHPTIVIATGREKKTYLAYGATGRKFIALASSKDLKKWDDRGVVLEPREHHFDALSLTPFYGEETKHGILLVYTARDGYGNATLGAALFDKLHPETLLWRSPRLIWSIPLFADKKAVRILSGVDRKKYFYVYLEHGDDIEAFPVAKYWETYVPETKPAALSKMKTKTTPEKKKALHSSHKLSRHEANPILEPQTGSHWESLATFNPAVIQAGGLIHLLYRAQGAQGLSVLGYAASRDGYSIHFRSKHPVYIPREKFEAGVGYTDPRAAYSKYMSGGGYGGCEDPKATVIDDRVYLTYVAYDGWSPPRIAFAWIPLADFLKHRWKKWSKPVLMSPPGVVDKSAAILPEKIGGKYVIFHRVFPNILIDFADSLDEFDGKTKFLRGEYTIGPRKDSWDRAKLSVGAPPIRTKAGWLVIYNAVTGLQEEPGSDTRYKMGAMLLDLKDPSKVIVRSADPILEPETDYENNGHKYGIIYPCGAAIKDDTLFVYYGASDKTTAVATSPLDTFLKALIAGKPSPLRKVTIK
jgi:predicted GH43/DUF377 family glycosyl hydrolase